MGQSGSSSGCVIMMDYLPVLLVATLVGSGLADPDPSLAAVNKAFTSFVHPSSSRPQPSYNTPSTSYKPASAYSNPAPAYGAPPEDKCYIKPSFNKEPNTLLLEVQQLQSITFTPDPCLDGPFNGNGTWSIEYLGPRPEEYDERIDGPPKITAPSRKVEGEAHSYQYTDANKEPYFIMLNVNKLIEESFTPDEEEPYGSHGHHVRTKRQIRGNGSGKAKTGRNKFKARGSLPGIKFGNASGRRQL